MCNNGVSLTTYSVSDRTGNISVSVFGSFIKFNLHDTIFFRNVKFNNGRYTFDHLSEAFNCDTEMSYVLEDSESSQELFSETSQKSLCESSPGYGTPTKRSKVQSEDYDSFYKDLKSLFEENKAELDLKEFLKFFKEEDILPHVGKFELIIFFLEVLNLQENRKVALSLLARIFQAIKIGEDTNNVEEEAQFSEFDILNASISSFLKYYTNVISKKEFLVIVLDLQEIHIDSLWGLIKSVLRNMRSGQERRNFRRKVENFLTMYRLPNE